MYELLSSLVICRTIVVACIRRRVLIVLIFIVLLFFLDGVVGNVLFVGEFYFVITFLFPSTLLLLFFLWRRLPNEVADLFEGL